VSCCPNKTSRTRAEPQVTFAGAILKSYGGSRGSKLGELDRPRYIALDREKLVFVADYGNRRVLLLDEHLKTQHVLLTWSRDRSRPWRLFYHRGRTEQLLIVGFYSGEVDIFWSLIPASIKPNVQLNA
jgi:hypothetical protein